MTHSIKKLAAGLLSIVMAAAMTTGCSSKKSSSSQEETVSSVSSEEAETSSATTTQTTTTTSTTTTTTTTAPLMPAMTAPVSSFDDFSANGSVRNIFTTSDNTLVFQVEGDYTNSCYIFDPVTGKAVREFTIPNCSEVSGVFSDGTIAVISRLNELKMFLYPKDSDTPQEVKLDVNDINYAAVDRVSDYLCFTDLSKEGIQRVDSSGNMSSMPLDRTIESFSDFDAENRTFCTDEYTADCLNGSMQFICSLDDGEPISEKTYGSWNTFLSGEKTCSAYISAKEGGTRKLDVYSVSDGKYEKTWKLPYAENVTYHYTGSRDSKYILEAYSNNYAEHLDSFHFIDPENGTTATLELNPAQSINWYYACYMERAKRWFIVYSTGTYYAGTSHIIMADPSLLKFDTKLETSESDRVDQTPTVCGEKFKDIRAEADKLEKEYGVRILVGDEVKDAEYGAQYKLISTESEIDGDYTYQDELENVRLLGNVLAMYPKDFFDHFKDKNGKGGMRIALVERLESEDYSNFTAAGVSYDTGSWFNIALQSMYAYDHGMFHHEMLHSVEQLINRKDQLNDDEWNKLNPYGFDYTRNFDDYATKYETDQRTLDSVLYNEVINHDTPYFISNYSLVTPMEDRATLIQRLFDFKYNDDGTSTRFGVEGIAEYPHLKAKLDFLAEWTKQEFGYVYWEELLKNTAKYDIESTKASQ